jgi:hypothetical protein
MPPEERLTKLRTLEEWLDYQLRTTRARIATLEADVERDRRQRERAYREQRWKLQPSRAAGDRTTTLHRGGCTMWQKEMGYLDRSEVLLALDDEDTIVEMCQICRPETGLRE